MAVSRGVPIFLVVLGAFVAVFALVMQFYGFQQLLLLELRENVPLRNGSQMWGIWQKTPLPVFMSFYIFNVTNPGEIINGSKPIVQEVGPFVYEETREKENITFHDGGDTVSYYQNIIFKFRRDMSSGDEDTNLTIINAPLVGAAQMLGILGYPLDYYSYTILVPHEHLFKNVTAGDLTFHGIDVEDFVQALEFAQALGVPVPKDMIPPEVLGGSFSAFGARNNSNDGLYKIYTGTSDLTKFAVIKEWKNRGSVEIWGDKYCDMINGTDGTQFPPLVTKKTILYSFLSDGCRSLHATYQKDVNIKGIPGYQFVAPKSLLDAPPENVNNKCFFPPGPDNKPLPSGALNMTKCRGGPVILTYPHFLNADPKLQAAVEGMNPDQEKHESFINLEPTSGGVLAAAKRVQLNVELQQFSDLDDFKNLSKSTVFPLLWISEGGELNEEYASMVKRMIVTPVQIMDVLGWVLLAVGAVLILIGFIVFRKCTRNSKEVV